MPSARLNGISIHYEARGSGPALVFAHGAGGNSMSWWQQLPYFSRSYRCVAFDHRAFGRSRDTRDGPGRRAFPEDLRELLDYLQIDTVAIVAQSMGGRTAVGFTARWPERVRALVFAGTTGGAVSDEVRAAQRRHQSSSIGRKSLAQRAISPGLRREQPELAFLYRLIGKLNPPRPKDFLAPIPGYIGSSAKRLAESGVPILYLVGSDDTITPPHIVRMAHEQVPGSRFEVIEGAGHSAYFEKAVEFNQRVERFLRAAGWTPES